MLSLIACYSMLAAIPLYVFSQVFFDDYDWFFTRKFPKRRPGILVLAVVIGVIAVDFALTPRVLRQMFVPRLYVFDGAVLLGPVLMRSLVRHSLCDLWYLAMIIGLVGTLAIPAISTH